MPKKRHKPEEIVAKLRQNDAKGVEMLKALGVTYTKPDLEPGRKAGADVHVPYEGKMWPEGLVEKIRALPENA